MVRNITIVFGDHNFFRIAQLSGVVGTGDRPGQPLEPWSGWCHQAKRRKGLVALKVISTHQPPFTHPDGNVNLSSVPRVAAISVSVDGV
jgi:hypothetical protein